MHITLSCPIDETPHLLSVRGLFDLAPERTSRSEWDLDAPIDAQPWCIGLVTGPSGCGKSTLARHLFPAPALWADALPPWPAAQLQAQGSLRSAWATDPSPRRLGSRGLAW